MDKSCSFTGHRRILPTHQRALTDLLDRAIAYAYSEGCRTFYSGGAVGFDTLAAQRVRLFRESHPDVRLVMLLPCVGQQEHWSWGQKLSYEHLLCSADEIVFISEEYTPDCMRKRNVALVEHADMMIAYCGRMRSGSSQTLAMASKKGIATYNLYTAAEKEGRTVEP